MKLNLFRRKKKKNNNTTTLVSGLRLQKYSDLNEDEKKKALKYIEYLNNPDNLLVKYSDDLSKKSDEMQAYLALTLHNSLENIEKIKCGGADYMDSLEQLTYYQQLYDFLKEYKKIYDDAKIRYAALEKYEQIFKRRKLRILNAFALANRLQRAMDEESIRSAKECLVGIMLVAVHDRTVVRSQLMRHGVEITESDIYNKASEIFKSDYCDAFVCSELIGRVLLRNGLDDSTDMDELIEFRRKCVDLKNAKDDGKDICVGDYAATRELLKNSKLIPFLAKGFHKINELAYAHRNDYKVLIDDIEKIYQYYHRTPTRMWDVEKMKEQNEKYFVLCANNIKLCRNILPGEVQGSIKQAAYKLNYHGVKYKECGFPFWRNTDPETKQLRLLAHLSNKKLERRTYHELFEIDMERVKAKLGIIDSLEEYYMFGSDEELAVLRDMYFYGEIPSNLKLEVKCKDFEVSLLIMAGLNPKKTEIENSREYRGFPFYEETRMSVEDLYYLTKLFGMNNYDFDKVIDQNFKESISKNIAASRKFNRKRSQRDALIYGYLMRDVKDLQFKVLIYKYLIRKLKAENYDRNILIIPKLIDFENGFKEMKRCLVESWFSDEKNIKQAIYVSNSSQLNYIYKFLEKRKLSNIYIMVNENDYNQFKGHSDNIICVPNEVHYSELDDYLSRYLDDSKNGQVAI